jgi:hypothetical protein
MSEQLIIRKRVIETSDAEKARNIGKVVNNSRFLVLPWVRIPHKAMFVKELSEDFREECRA